MKKSIVMLISIFMLLLSVYSNDKESEKNQDISLFQKGLEIINQIDMLAEDDDYIQLFSNDSEINEITKEIGNGDYTTPVAVYEIVGMDRSCIKFLEAEMQVSLNEEIVPLLRDKVGESFPSMLNAQNGALFLAATSMLPVSDSFIFDGLDEQKIYLYLYDSNYHSIVSFTPNDENIVIVSASIVASDLLSDIETADDVQEFLTEMLAFSDIDVTQVYK